MEKIPVKLYVYDISRGFAKQLSPLLLGESFIHQWKSCKYNSDRPAACWVIRMRDFSYKMGYYLIKKLMIIYPYCTDREKNWRSLVCKFKI